MPNTLHTALRRFWALSAIRYLVVGGFCFLVDIGLLWLAHEVLRLPLSIATPLSFLASFAVTYTLQRIVAFEAETKVVSSVARYTALVAFNTVATTGIVWIIDQWGGGWVVGKVIAVIATTVWNFFAYRHWVFVTPVPRDADV